MRRSVPAACVLALHAMLIGILLASGSPPRRRFVRLQVVRLYLAALRPAAPRLRRGHRTTRGSAPPRLHVQVRLVPHRSLSAMRASLSDHEPRAPAIPWLEASKRAARAIVSRQARPRVLMGFPRANSFPPVPRTRSWDGWDFAATHRIQRLASGGTAVLLNEHCAIDFEPFPIFGCALGQPWVPGDLFKSMRHRAAGALP